jgi:hypothetical protein
MQPEQAEVPPQQLQAAVRGQLPRHELDGQISLDDASQPRYRQPHQKGLEGIEGPFFHANRILMPGLCSDQG